MLRPRGMGFGQVVLAQNPHLLPQCKNFEKTKMLREMGDVVLQSLQSLIHKMHQHTGVCETTLL